MELTVLVVPDCPHAPLLRERLDRALADRPDVRVSWCEITDSREAEQARMHGSPTLLVDGTDPFSLPGQPPSLSCRIGGLPTEQQIRVLLTETDSA